MQKAFDTVEYILLERLYKAGVNGKMWKFLNDLYQGGKARVRVDGQLSEEYSEQRGVKQGCVLSRALLLLVMNPLLKQLQSTQLGLTVNEFYSGRFLHADDIRTLATSEASLQAQVALVNEFTTINFS